jgi:superfamily II DNA or RNA helicase
MRPSKIERTHKDAIIVASYGVFSTGVNVRRLHNLVFAAAGKSKIRTLQSIGRGLRTHVSKSYITLYDIVDDLRIGIRRNYAWKHAEMRSILYAEEKFPVTIRALDLERFVERTTKGSGSPRLDDECRTPLAESPDIISA